MLKLTLKNCKFILKDKIVQKYESAFTDKFQFIGYVKVLWNKGVYDE